MIDLGTGNNNKINWPMNDGQELIDIIETVYRGARKGRGYDGFLLHKKL
jgi:U5 snRNP protein, DIM1 family